MNLHEFKKKFDEMYATCATHHKVNQEVNFYIIDSNDVSWELKLNDQLDNHPGFSYDTLPGCGSEVGIIFNLRMKDIR